MRFTAAAVLLLSSHAASTDENIVDKGIRRNKLQNTRRGETLQEVAQNRSRQREMQKSPSTSFIRRLANRRNDQAPTKPSFVESKADSTSLDLGVLDKTRSHYNRALRESIFDENSIREPNRAEIYEPEIEVYRMLLLDELKLYCSVDDAFTKCDCENFDFDSVNGTIECTYSDSDGSDFCQTTPNYCGEPVEICYRLSVSFEATSSDEYSYTYCHTYTSPYQQHVCTTFDHEGEYEEHYFGGDNSTTAEHPPSHSGSVTFTTPSLMPCSVQFNDMECNSCSTIIQTTQENYFDPATNETKIVSIYEDRCFLIDCSNTGDKTNIVNTCDSGSYPTTLKEKVIFGDDCTRCQPCGIGYNIKNLDAEGYFPVIGEYQCSGLELAAKIGFFDRKFCPEVQKKTAEYCDCEPLFYDESLVWTPETAPETTRSKASPKVGAPPILLPGNTIGDVACDVCGRKQAIVANPTAIVSLPNGVLTSCAALEGAGRLGMFTPTYCLSEVMPLVFRTCGGCYHEHEDHMFDPGSILTQPSPTHEEPEPEVESDSEDSNFVVGEGLMSCDICEEGSVLLLPNNVFTLSKEEISCQDFEERLKNTAVTESFCVEEASAIGDEYCGGCVPKPVADLIHISIGNDSAFLATRAGDSHRANPEELDVYSGSPSVENHSDIGIDEDEDEDELPWTNSVISQEESSAQPLRHASTAWMTMGVISLSFLFYFS